MVLIAVVAEKDEAKPPLTLFRRFSCVPNASTNDYGAAEVVINALKFHYPFSAVALIMVMGKSRE